MTRPSKLEYFMQIVDVVKTRSRDPHTQVGCLLVHRETDAILATGYNSFVRGVTDAQLPTTSPEKYPYMLHAEDNVIAHCAKHGISTAGCMVVLNVNPCAACIRKLWQAGIQFAIVKELYSKYFQEVLDMKDINVAVRHDPVTTQGFYFLTFSPKQYPISL